jgi:hypothetical protein
MNLTRVRNPHAVLRMVRPAEHKPSARADWSESGDCVRAQSIMTPTPRGGACPPLTLAQARDVLAWYRPTNRT